MDFNRSMGIAIDAALEALGRNEVWWQINSADGHGPGALSTVFWVDKSFYLNGHICVGDGGEVRIRPGTPEDAQANPVVIASFSVIMRPSREDVLQMVAEVLDAINKQIESRWELLRSVTEKEASQT